jgi:hypothetical protein
MENKASFSCCYLDLLPDWVEKQIQEKILKADLNLINAVFCSECAVLKRNIKKQLTLESMRGLFGYIENILLKNETMAGDFDEIGGVEVCPFDFEIAMNESWMIDGEKYFLYEQLQSDYELIKKLYSQDLTKSQRNSEAYMRKYFYFLMMRFILGFKAYNGAGVGGYGEFKRFNAIMYFSLKEKKVCNDTDLTLYESGEKVDADSIYAFCVSVLKTVKNHNDEVMDAFEHETGRSYYQYAKQYFYDAKMRDEYEKAFEAHDIWVDEKAKHAMMDAWGHILGVDIRSIKKEYRKEFSF